MGKRTLLSLTLFLPLIAALPARAEQAQMLTMDELHKLYDAKQYRDVLKAMLPILQLKGPAAAPYDRHKLLTLKAQTHLQLSDQKSALDAIDLDHKEAVAAEDKNRIDETIAFFVLVQKSPHGAYTPKNTDPGGSKKPIDITDNASRKTAYEALFKDELVPLQAKAKEASLARTLPPILTVAKAAGDLQSIERVANGDNKQTEKIVADLSDRALKLVSTELANVSDQVDRIGRNAQTMITDQVPINTVGPDGKPMTTTANRTRPRGLINNDGQLLQGYAKECDQVGPVVESLAEQLRANADQFKAQETKAKEIKVKIATILNTDYSSQQSINSSNGTTTPRR